MDTTKKEENRKPRKKRNRRPESQESVNQGLLLVPIHRDTLMDSKTKKGSVVEGLIKKRRKQKTKKKEVKGPKLIQLSYRGQHYYPFIGTPGKTWKRKKTRCDEGTRQRRSRKNRMLEGQKLRKESVILINWRGKFQIETFLQFVNLFILG